MDIKAASVEEIAEFKMAAARRYQERGVPANVAGQLFDHTMAKIAADLGAAPVEQPQRAAKVAELLSTKVAENRAKRQA